MTPTADDKKTMPDNIHLALLSIPIVAASAAIVAIAIIAIMTPMSFDKSLLIAFGAIILIIMIILMVAFISVVYRDGRKQEAILDGDEDDESASL